MKKILFILLAFIIMILAGCTSKDSVSKESTTAENPFTKKESKSTNDVLSKKTSESTDNALSEKESKSTDNILSSNVAATVNDEAISLSDFQRRLHKKLFVMKANGQPVPGSTKEEQQKYLQDSVIQELVKEHLLLSIGKEHNILPTEQELQGVLNQIKSNFPSEEMFKQTMLSRGLNEENIINFNRVQIIKERLAAKFGSLEKANQYISDLENSAKIRVNQTIITPLIQQEL